MGESDGLLKLVKMPEQLGGTVFRPVSLCCSLSHWVMVVVFFCFHVGEGRIMKYLFYSPALSFSLRARERKRERESEREKERERESVCVCVCVIVSTSLCVQVLMECIYIHVTSSHHHLTVSFFLLIQLDSAPQPSAPAPFVARR